MFGKLHRASMLDVLILTLFLVILFTKNPEILQLMVRKLSKYMCSMLINSILELVLFKHLSI